MLWCVLNSSGCCWFMLLSAKCHTITRRGSIVYDALLTMGLTKADKHQNRWVLKCLILECPCLHWWFQPKWQFFTLKNKDTCTPSCTKGLLHIIKLEEFTFWLLFFIGTCFHDSFPQVLFPVICQSSLKHRESGFHKRSPSTRNKPL